MANEVLVGLKIGAVVAGSLSAAFGSAKSTVQQLGRATDGLTAKQKLIGTELSAALARGGTGVERLRRQYDLVGHSIDQLKVKQDRLTASIARGETLKNKRGELRGQALEVAGTGAALGAPIVQSMRTAIEFQDQPRDIAITGGFDDSLSVELEDSEGKWRDAWYPGHGDSLSLAIGWDGQQLRTVGSFEIDRVELNGPPFTVTIEGLATGIKASLRITEHRAYENTTLDAVAKQIATRQGLELVGSIEPIKLDRLTQQNSDLEFLRDLAGEYDFAFKVTGSRMVFHAISELAKAAPVATFTLGDLSRINLQDQIKDIPQAIEVKHKDPAKKKLVVYKIENGETVAYPLA